MTVSSIKLMCVDRISISSRCITTL